jgi:hypothetical protein
VTFSGVHYFVVEAPGAGAKAAFQPFLSSAGDPAVEAISAAVSLPAAPSGSIQAYFFLNDINAFIHVCAEGVAFAYDV